MELVSRVQRAAYRAHQLSWLVPTMALQNTARRLARLPAPEVTPEAIRLMQKRYQDLLTRDLDNVAQGLYPASLLFQLPTTAYLKQVPALVRDAPRIMRRMRDKNHRDLPADVDVRRYPPYYRRNFHWQSDGYFSRRSAELYDVGVEFLFHGTADIMRRQIIPPVTRHIAGRDPRSVRLVDIGCGTGRTLKQLSRAHPRLRYTGVDLSPYYVQVARDNLRHVEDLSLLVDNAEALPLADASFDVVTSVYLLHELPRAARRKVMREMYRIVAPGGIVVLEDSTQPSDSPALGDILDSFARTYHEPFYPDYLKDDLSDLATEAGFTVKSVETHMVAKVVVATRPLSVTMKSHGAVDP